jgi:hypothetical protein
LPRGVSDEPFGRITELRDPDSFSRILRDSGYGPKQTYFVRASTTTRTRGRPTPLDFRFARFAAVSPDDYFG